MLHLSLSLTAFFAVAPLVNAAPDAAISDDVPAEYAAVVPQEAIAVAWVTNPHKIVSEALSMGAPGQGAPTTLNGMFNDAFKSTATIPLTDSIIFWVDQLPKLGGSKEDFTPSFAFKADGANAKNTTAVGQNQVFFSGDMVIVRGSSNGTWTKPAEHNTRMMSALPAAEVALAFDGKHMDAELEMAMRQLSALGMFMAQARMKQREQAADPADRAIIAKTQRQGLDGMQRLVASALGVMKTVDVLTLGVNLTNGNLDIDIDLHYPERIQANHGVDKSLVESVPGGMPIYLAMDGPATRWFAAMEHDVMEVFLALDAKQIKVYEKMGQQGASLASMVTGGLAVGFGVKDRYEWGVADVDNATSFMTRANMLMKEMNNLNIGVTTSSVGNDTWAIDVDGAKLAKLLGGSKTTQAEQAARFGGNFVLSHTASGNRITSKRHPAGKPNFPTSKNTTIRDMLEPHQGALIAGLSMDLGEVAHGIATEVASEMHHNHGHGGAAPRIPNPKGLVPFSLVLTNPDEKTIQLHIDVAAMKAFAYFMELEFAMANMN